MNTIERIRANTTRSLLCVGLDPDLSKMPTAVTNQHHLHEDAIYAFLTRVIDVTAPFVACYKAQKAMFDVLSAGHDTLKAVIAYAYRYYPHLPVIVDCKVGDIDNTMASYVESIFGKLQAAGIVVNPLMGDDVLAPLSELKDKAVIVLCKTSNPGGSIVQDVLMADGRPLWEHLLELTTTRWNSNGNMIPVVSSTAGLDMAHVRRLIPDNMPVLLAGVGAQGGSYADLGKLLNGDRANVFVNSSRGILYPYDRNDEFWLNRVADAARAMMIDMEAQR